MTRAEGSRLLLLCLVLVAFQAADEPRCTPVPVEEAVPCDDGDPCTTDDVWANDVCVGVPLVCDDRDPCTDDSCDPSLGCVFTAVEATCADGPIECVPEGCRHPGPCQVVSDESRTTYTYDDQGNLMVEERDDGDDGTVDFRSTYTYDEQGNPLTRWDDLDGDGPHYVEDYLWVATYDDEGKRLTEDWGWHFGGASFEFVDGGWQYSYDAQGNRTGGLYCNHGQYYSDWCDRWAWTYDDQGNRLSEEWYERNEELTSRTTWTYDAAGNRLTEARDTDADGTVDERRAYTYDAAGNLLTEEVVESASGTTGTRTTYTYDVAGNLLTAEQTDPNGVVVERRSYSYDCWE